MKLFGRIRAVNRITAQVRSGQLEEKRVFDANIGTKEVDKTAWSYDYGKLSFTAHGSPEQLNVFDLDDELVIYVLPKDHDGQMFPAQAMEDVQASLLVAERRASDAEAKITNAKEQMTNAQRRAAEAERRASAGALENARLLAQIEALQASRATSINVETPIRIGGPDATKPL